MYQPAPRTNGFAIASFICSLVCINILGIIFGHVALSQIKRTNEGGQGLAIAGLIIGYISLGIVILAVILSGPSVGY
jgi:peptidyl-prolyl cis-trans isomerase B (cyclophilin B)